MDRYLGKFSSQIYTVFRLVAGLLFAQHGAQKLFGVLGGFGGEPGVHAQYFSLMDFAGAVEFFGGLLIAIGLFGSTAAFIASGQMALAYFRAHAPNGFFPIQNRGELAMVYCFLFLYIAAHGSGIWSLDALRKGQRK